MKTPPPREDQLRSPAAPLPESDRRFLVFAAIVLIAVAFGFKSELVAPRQVWTLSAALVLIAIPAVFVYLRAEAMLPPVEHYVPAVIGAMVVAGLSPLIPEWWKYAIVVVAFGLGFYLATVLDRRRLRDRLKPGHVIVQESVLGLSLAGGYLVVLSSPFDIVPRLILIFLLTVFATYRAFRILGRTMSPRRGLLFSAVVAQVVAFLAMALSVYSQVGEGAEAVMLFLAWYINRGLVQHTVEETLTRQVFLEYGAFGAVLAYLFFISSQAH